MITKLGDTIVRVTIKANPQYGEFIACAWTLLPNGRTVRYSDADSFETTREAAVETACAMIGPGALPVYRQDAKGRLTVVEVIKGGK